MQQVPTPGIGQSVALRLQLPRRSGHEVLCCQLRERHLRAGGYNLDTYHEIDHILRSEAEGVYDSEEESGNDMGFEQM
jgi:hypothetical protein